MCLWPCREMARGAYMSAQAKHRTEGALMRTKGLVALAAAIAVPLAIVSVGQGLYGAAAEYKAPPLRTDLLADFSTKPKIRQVNEHLYRLDGLAVVVAWGSPEQMGQQYGRAVRDMIHRAVQQYLIGKVVKEWGFPLDYLLRCARDMERHIPDEYIREMRALADAAGIDYRTVLEMHTHADIVHYGKSWGRPDAAPGKECSNFAVWGRWTTDGQLIHGRNLDWTTSTGVQEQAVVYIGKPQRGVPFAIVTHAGLIGGVTGMNKAGITMGEMTSSSSAETLDGLPLMLVFRYVLQHCRTLEEAVAFMTRQYKPTTGWNFVIGDGKKPEAVALEVDAAGVQVFRAGDPRENDPPLHWAMPDCVRRTNHFVDREHQKRQYERVKDELPVQSFEAARMALRLTDTWRRYAALSAWIKANRGRIDARLARALLQTAPVGGDGNLHSVVMKPADQMMWVANAAFEGGKGRPGWAQHYVPIPLARFWK